MSRGLMASMSNKGRRPQRGGAGRGGSAKASHGQRRREALHHQRGRQRRRPAGARWPALRGAEPPLRAPTPTPSPHGSLRAVIPANHGRDGIAGIPGTVNSRSSVLSALFGTTGSSIKIDGPRTNVRMNRNAALHLARNFSSRIENYGLAIFNIKSKKGLNFFLRNRESDASFFFLFEFPDTYTSELQRNCLKPRQFAEAEGVPAARRRRERNRCTSFVIPSQAGCEGEG